MSITRTEFANELNIHKSRVTRLVQKGLPTENDGNIKVPDAYHWYQENVLNGEGGNDPRSITTLQAKKLAEEAEIKRLERLHKSGKLIDRSQAEQLAFDFFRHERDAWLSWPSRVAPEVANELGCDPHHVGEVLDRYVRNHLQDLADTEPTLAE